MENPTEENQLNIELPEDLAEGAYVNLAFVGISGWLAQVLSLEADPSIWFSFVLSMVLLGWIMRKG